MWRARWSLLMLWACGGEEQPSGPDPSIAIASPIDGETISTAPAVDGTEPELEIEMDFSVSHFTLKRPGTCDGEDACGHVHIRVDGDLCNSSDSTGRLDYNEEVFASPAGANLMYCDSVTVGVDGVLGADGVHDVSAELFDDDEQPVLDTSGAAIVTTVHVTVEVVQP